jgi:hypothetical protein
LESAPLCRWLQPSANVQVIETFIVHVDGAASARTRHRIAVAGGAGLGA